MKLVLLPGMDGTGNLFSPLLYALSGFDCTVIPLPNTGPQDYVSISRPVIDKLPKEDFILIAESFSGPLATALAKEGIDNLKGIIFVATFLSTPRKYLLSIAKKLPLKLLANLPLTEPLHKRFFLGIDASCGLIDLFRTTLRSLPSEIIKERLKSLHSLAYKPEKIHLPAAYIQATSDKLVPPDKAIEFERCFENLIIKSIEGPHFILQAKPAASAEAISELVPLLTGH